MANVLSLQMNLWIGADNVEDTEDEWENRIETRTNIRQRNQWGGEVDCIDERGQLYDRFIA